MQAEGGRFRHLSGLSLPSYHDDHVDTLPSELTYMCNRNNKHCTCIPYSDAPSMAVTFVDLKGLAHVDLAKKTNLCMTLCCFRYDFSVALISALALLKYAKCKTKCSGLKIDWVLPTGCSYLRNACYVITSSCFTHVTHSACVVSGT